MEENKKKTSLKEKVVMLLALTLVSCITYQTIDDAITNHQIREVYKEQHLIIKKLEKNVNTNIKR